MATQMQLKVLFGKKKTFERKIKQQQSRVFFAVIWEKELEQVIKNKSD